MKFERVFFYPSRPDVWLDCYIPDVKPPQTRDAVLVIPGGGYAVICSRREGDPVALAFLPYGFISFVLHYSAVGTDTKYPEHLIEASMAMAYIRENAEALHVNPSRVFTVGFSAGGHLAGSLAIQWKKPEVVEAVGGIYGCNRPDGAILCYPVVSGDPEVFHEGSISNLFCTGSECPNDDQLAEASLELHVDGDSSPLFLMHTSTDQMVDVRNSLRLATAYREAGLPFEMHVFYQAPHGVALANELTADGEAEWIDERIAKWVSLAASWAKALKAEP